MPAPPPVPLPAVPEAPVIDTQRTYAYDQIFLCWRLPQHSPPAWHYTVEYRKTDAKAKGLKLWQRREEVRGTSALVEYLDTDSVYVLRVKGCNKAGFGEYSEDIYLHTPPAPGEGTPPRGAASPNPPASLGLFAVPFSPPLLSSSPQSSTSSWTTAGASTGTGWPSARTSAPCAACPASPCCSRRSG